MLLFQFCIEDFYCTVNKIILNMYSSVISKKYTIQEITLVHNIIGVDVSLIIDDQLPLHI